MIRAGVLAGSVLLVACSSPLDGNSDGGADLSGIPDMTICPQFSPSSGAVNPKTCSEPPTKVCGYFEAYCLCLSGEWNCCGNGQPIPCYPQEPATGDPCCQSVPRFSSAGPICQYGCAGGMTKTCVCGDDLRWQCSSGPLPDGGVPGCDPDAGI